LEELDKDCCDDFRKNTIRIFFFIKRDGCLLNEECFLFFTARGKVKKLYSKEMRTCMYVGGFFNLIIKKEREKWKLKFFFSDFLTNFNTVLQVVSSPVSYLLWCNLYVQM